MRLFGAPLLLRLFFPKRIWRMPAEDKAIYLTFDDGPTPELLPFILQELANVDAKATFFCVGQNAARHPALMHEIKSRGHAIGNHTYSHLNGYKTPTAAYIKNTLDAAAYIDSKLFRPPYGKLTHRQAKQLHNEGYKIIMWSLLTYDFDYSADTDFLWQQAKLKLCPGAIVVLHDNLKAENHLRLLLPAILQHGAEKGYRFKALSL